jgi:hypothetical protein
MDSIKLTSRVGSDGILTLQVPIGMSNTEVEVVLVIQPIQQATEQRTTESFGWPAGFFEETYGAFLDTPLERPDQGELEVRESLV